MEIRRVSFVHPQLMRGFAFAEAEFHQPGNSALSSLPQTDLFSGVKFRRPFHGYSSAAYPRVGLFHGLWCKNKVFPSRHQYIANLFLCSRNMDAMGLVYMVGSSFVDAFLLRLKSVRVRCEYVSITHTTARVTRSGYHRGPCPLDSSCRTHLPAGRLSFCW